MVLEFFRGGADSELEQIEALIRQMLTDDRHTFDLAITAVLGGADAATVGPEIHKTDIRVNKAERKVRRKLVVHTSVHGHRADLPFVLTSMSIVKDAERIGDYSKNIWDLAHAGIDFSGASDLAELSSYRERTSHLIGEAARILGDKDIQAAHDLLQEHDRVLDEYDDCILTQIESAGPARDAVPRALLCRYLKRITAHVMNVLTSLVMPVDRLDYYDEDKADRI